MKEWNITLLEERYVLKKNHSRKERKEGEIFLVGFAESYILIFPSVTKFLLGCRCSQFLFH